MHLIPEKAHVWQRWLELSKVMPGDVRYIARLAEAIGNALDLSLATGRTIEQDGVATVERLSRELDVYRWRKNFAVDLLSDVWVHGAELKRHYQMHVDRQINEHRRRACEASAGLQSLRVMLERMHGELHEQRTTPRHVPVSSPVVHQGSR